MAKKIAVLAICAIFGVFAVGCGAPEEKVDDSMVVDQSKAPAMDGGTNVEGGAPSGAAPQSSNEGG